MPWQNEFDHTEPQDINSAAEGAEEIRLLKRALIERLSTAYRGFPDENPERPGEPLLFPIAGCEVGTEAQRPPIPVREGHIWFSTDTKSLYIGTAIGNWQLAAVGEATEGIGHPRVKIAKQNSSLGGSGEQTLAFGPNIVEWNDFDMVLRRGGVWFDETESLTDFIVPATGPYLVQASLGLRYIPASRDYAVGISVTVSRDGGIESTIGMAVGGYQGFPPEALGPSGHVSMSTIANLEQGDIINVLATTQYSGGIHIAVPLVGIGGSRFQAAALTEIETEELPEGFDYDYGYYI